MMMAAAIAAKVAAVGTAAVGAATSAASAAGGALGIGSAAAGTAAASGGFLSGVMGSAVGAAKTAAVASKGVSALKILSATSGALQSFSKFAASNAQANQAEQSALDELLAKDQDSLNAQRRVTEINRQFLDVVGQQRVAFASGGIDLGSGSVQSARYQSLAEANRQINDVWTNDDFSRRIRDVRAKNYRNAARDARKAGMFGAIGSFAGTMIDTFGSRKETKK